MRVIGGSRGPKPSKRIELYNQIKKDIFDGKYVERLPGVAKLAKIYNSNSAMIQIVIHELENDKIVEIKKKSGTYLTHNIEEKKFAFISFERKDYGFNAYNMFHQEYGNIELGVKQRFKEAGEVCDFKFFDDNDFDSMKKFIANYNRIIILYPVVMHRQITELLKDKFYARVMGVPNYSNKGGHITYDNEEIGTIAANYLMNNNSSRYVYIGTDRLLLFKQRYEAFVASLNYKNHDVEHIHIDKENMTQKELYQVLNSFFKENFEDLKSKKMGIFCGADYFLQAIKQELNLLGLNLTDVNIISCDNNPYYLKDIYPTCPTIDIRMKDIGSRAATIALFSSDHFLKEAIAPKLIIPDNQ